MSNTPLTDKEVDTIILKLLKNHRDDVVVNEEEFLDLLKHSLSLNTDEKKRVIDAVPKTDSQPGLAQFQFDELKKVFIEEREKFRELAGKHPEDIKKLIAKQKKEWIQLGEIYKIEEEKKQKEEKEAWAIDDIKAQLGL